MLDILPALLWIIAAVIAVNICSITAIRGNLFSKIGALPYPVYAMFRSDFSAKFRRFYEHVGWPSAAVMVMLIAAELVFMYLQARNGMHSEMERKLNQAVK